MNPLAAAIRRHYGWTALALVPGLALAGPGGEQIVQGTVGVTRPDANTTTVTQGSSSAVVNWHSFSVDGQEYVQFVQPGANAAILNRVTGGSASQILGRIDANGRVFLVNPQGVYFAAGAQVETAGFAASTLDIADDDFMQGRYVFAKGTGAPAAAVTNAGELKGDGFVVLMGDRVANEGLVQARLGTVALAAGEKISLQLDGSGL
ncbi:MAG: filamentous hemagglutinin N-terminal domain-containing protein, partial [Gammaproteobacteria bacterium]